MPWGTGHSPRLGQSGWERTRTRTRILERDAYRCYIPGCQRTATHVDHIIPLSQGGTNTDDNLGSMCKPHHDAKTTAEAAHGRAQRSRKRPPEPHPGAAR